jgi:4-hydroxy-3-methylbut-2-en-1-yl diphosphate synthase IspG/GcpE
VALADPLKADMLVLNPYIEDGLRLADAVAAHGWEYTKSVYPESRRILQVYGTDVVRDGFHPSIWAERLLRDTEVTRSYGVNIVVPDVRFPEEVVVPPLDLLICVVKFDVPVVGPTHASEQGINDCIDAARDAGIPVRTILNDGTIAQLHESVLNAVGPYL